jgi:prepilin-type N-terminal cleavage/methylation domain-containing protein
VNRRAFTLIELLVTLSICALLVGLLLPALGVSRHAARATLCSSNQRQLVIAWQMYAGDYRGLSMPAADEQQPGGIAYWWGRITDGSPPRIEREHGIAAAYLADTLRERSVFECPAQAWGTYRPQPASLAPPGLPTSTYGYNGYGLCPPATPGWNLSIGSQRWKRVDDLQRPGDVFVFADAMLPGTMMRNTVLLDPPMLFSSGQWSSNLSPTTCFRHPGGSLGSAIAGRADGSVRGEAAQRDWLSHPESRIGSAGATNAPHYVEDWEQWR